MEAPRKKTIYLSPSHTDSILKHLQAQFREGRNCDLEIRLGKKRLYVHKCLVDSFFLKAGAELEDDRFFLDLSRYSQPVIEALVGMMYSGHLKCAPQEVADVYVAAVTLGCEEAATGCMANFQETGMAIPSLPSSDIRLEPTSLTSVEPPDPFSVSFSTSEVADPKVIIKTEPPDDPDDAVTDTGLMNYLSGARYDTVPERPESGCIYTTVCVPVTGPDAGKPVDMSRPKTVMNQMSSGHTKVYSSNLGSKVHPALNNRGKYAVGSSGLDERKSRKGARKRFHPGSDDGHIREVIVTPQDVAKTMASQKRNDDERSLVEEKIESKQNRSRNEVSLSEREELDAGKDNEADKSAGVFGELVKCTTKSGIVYYKPKNPRLVHGNGFSANLSNLNADSGSASSDQSSKPSSVEKDLDDSYSKTQEIKVEVETDKFDDYNDIQTDSHEKTEEVKNDDALQREQMSFLGLAKSDQIKSLQEKKLESSGKRRLRERKRVDYSQFDDSDESGMETVNKITDRSCDGLQYSKIYGAGQEYLDKMKVRRIRTSDAGTSESWTHSESPSLEMDADTKPVLQSKSKRRFRERSSSSDGDSESVETPVAAKQCKIEDMEEEEHNTVRKDFAALRQMLRGKLEKHREKTCDRSDDSSEHVNNERFSPKSTSVQASVLRGNTSVAVPVEQSVNAEDPNSDEEFAYFPAAGTVPQGVRSQYARGSFVKLKTVTEEKYDKDGNVTVVTKKIPLRPRQFGLDERLMKRPSVYICHPVAPVVKTVVKNRRRY